MARPGTYTHRKFVRLARTLRDAAKAAGCLEFIWAAAYEAGDPNVGSPEDMEYLARWDGEAGVLARALIDAGFIDVDADGNCLVHDLFDHAPDYVQRRMQREAERKEKGVTISELRADAGRKGGRKRAGEQTEASGEQMTGVCLLAADADEANDAVCLGAGEANGATPAPAPAPAPNSEEGGGGDPDPSIVPFPEAETPRGRAEREAQRVLAQCGLPADTPKEAVALAHNWVHYCRRRGRSREAADTVTMAAPEMEALLAAGVAAEAIRDAIAAKGRDRTEYLWQFKKRLMPRATGPPARAGGDVRDKVRKDRIERETRERQQREG